MCEGVNCLSLIWSFSSALSEHFALPAPALVPCTPDCTPLGFLSNLVTVFTLCLLNDGKWANEGTASLPF